MGGQEQNPLVQQRFGYMVKVDFAICFDNNIADMLLSLQIL